MMVIISYQTLGLVSILHFSITIVIAIVTIDHDTIYLKACWLIYDHSNHYKLILWCNLTLGAVSVSGHGCGHWSVVKVDPSNHDQDHT